jgi:hypothetical protein
LRLNGPISRLISRWLAEWFTASCSYREKSPARDATGCEFQHWGNLTAYAATSFFLTVSN